jgi:hypothetical protein
MKEEKLHTILDEDIEQVLDRFGQLESIRNGEIRCGECGLPLSEKRIQIIVPLKNGSFNYICDNSDCIQAYLKKTRVP